ncbi:hypothetical protein MTO96_038756 [Rhipicephalus appendiculatus]
MTAQEAKLDKSDFEGPLHDADRSIQINWLYWGLLVPMSIGLITSSFVVLPSMEIGNEARDLQLMTGVSGCLYLGANFFFDLLFYLVPLTAIYVGFAMAFNVSISTQDDAPSPGETSAEAIRPNPAVAGVARVGEADRVREWRRRACNTDEARAREAERKRRQRKTNDTDEARVKNADGVREWRRRAGNTYEARAEEAERKRLQRVGNIDETRVEGQRRRIIQVVVVGNAEVAAGPVPEQLPIAFAPQFVFEVVKIVVSYEQSSFVNA